MKIQLFKISASTLWPVLRCFVSSKISTRCKKCLNSERYQSLEEGLCKDCILSGDSSDKVPIKDNQSENNQRLDESIKSYINTGTRGFDALVLFSGGKDSTLMVYKLLKDYPKLRLICVTIDNGIMSPVGLQNIQIIVEKLNLNHLLYKPGDEVFKRSFKYAIEQVKGRGCSHIVDRVDGDLFHDIAFHLAAKMEIPLVLSGLSVEQVQDIIQIQDFILPKSYLDGARKLTGPLPLSEFTMTADYQNYWWDSSLYTKVPEVIYPNYVWNYTHEEIMTVLIKECGLKESQLDPMITNNLLIPVMGVIDIRQMGYSSFEPEFSKLVRRGIAPRTLWINRFEFIEYLAKYTKIFDKEVNDMFEYLGVERQEVFDETKP